MEAVILSGIQAAGKTTFYLQRFFNTHVRISLDLLGTRARERKLLDACLAARQPFVVDNTNVRREDRAVYVAAAKAQGFRVTCYYFVTDPKAALARNRQREGKAVIPAGGLFGTHKRLEPPTLAEGFDALFRVEITDPGAFAVTPLTA
ncbi:MAG TPA: ATP-binding protein [Gemmatimonadaceae bacterium]|nr:ATP-binding protein [Gemmatimonadaceae bacterium]